MGIIQEGNNDVQFKEQKKIITKAFQIKSVIFLESEYKIYFQHGLDHEEKLAVSNYLGEFKIEISKAGSITIIECIEKAGFKKLKDLYDVVKSKFQ